MIKIKFAVALCSVLLWCMPATAQVTTGQISGTVKDSSGAAIPAAGVVIVDEQTSLTRRTTADGDGFYLISNLPPGSYQVKVEQPGFKSFVRAGIQLTAGDRADISPALEIGDVTEVVTVSTQGELVETESGTVGQLVDGSQVRNLALNGRNPAQLLMLVPGVAVTTDQFDRGGIAFGGVGDFYVNGSRSTSNSVTVDGGSNQDSGNVVSQTNNLSVDFIGEVKIASSGYSAEYGRFAGAQINFSTRRGTEEYHGTLLEFFRNDVLNARSFFAPQKEKLRLNNFGWNFGGPIPGPWNSGRKKLFFFGGQEYKRRVDGDTRRATIPTREERSGVITSSTVLRYPSNFPVVALRGQQIADPSRATAANPQGLNILPRQYATASGQAMMRIFDVMESQATLYLDQRTGNNITFQLANVDIRRQDVLRLDYIPSERNQFSLRYLYDTGTNSVPYETGTIPTFRATRTNRATNVQLSWTSVISPKTVNEVAGVSNYLFLERFPYGEFAAPDTYGLQINELFGDETDVYGIPTIAIAGFTSISGARANPHSPVLDLSLRDNLTHLRGKHNLKTGALFIHNQKNERSNAVLTGSVAFNPSGNTLTTGSALLDTLLGNYRSYTESDVDKFNYIRFSQFEAYAADTWKARPNLTLDFGLRYHLIQAPYTIDNTSSTFLPSAYDPSRAQQVIRSGQGAGELVPGVGQPYNGIVVAGDEYPDPERVAARARNLDLFGGLPRGFYDTTHKFSPRFGFAYDLLSNGNLAVRGGAAIYYDRLPAGDMATAGGNPPYINTVTLFDGRFDELGGGRSAAFPVSVTSYHPSVVPSEVYNWNLGVQHRLPFETLLDVNYVSTQGRHLLRRPNINQVAPAVQVSNPGVNINALRRYQGYTDINLWESSASSSYHGMQLGVTRRFSTGLTYSVAYTWSKVLTDASDRNNGVENILDYRSERSHASFDRNHVFVLSYGYDLPFFSNRTDLLGKLIGGWQLSGITQFQSGPWLTPTINTPTGARRPNRVGEVAYFDPREVQTLIGGNNQAVTGNFFFDPTPGATFIAPAANQFGNSAPFVIRGPGRNNWDLSLFKNFRLNERFNIQFRTEAFNVWNHASFRSPNTNASAREYGTISDAGPPRLIQFGLKLLF